MNTILAAYLSARRRRAECRHLQNMNDRMLADIGLTRRDIMAMIGGETPAALKTRF